MSRNAESRAMISQVLAQAINSGPTDVLAALRDASAKTGSDFTYLLGTAMRESSLQTQAKSGTSSATGLFQFVDQTWLSLIKRYGSGHGLGQYSEAIQQGPGGRLTVASADMKSAILALRKNPEVSSLMAGEAAADTKANMQDTLGREVSCGELYAAHFLGQGNACKLIAMNGSNPGGRADLAFPQAAKANPHVFYAADGTPKTVGQVYDWAVSLPTGAHASRSSSGRSVTALETSAAVSDAKENGVARLAAPQARSWHAHAGDAAIMIGGIGSFSHMRPSPALPLPALNLTPGVLEILSSLDAASADRRAA